MSRTPRRCTACGQPTSRWRRTCPTCGFVIDRSADRSDPFADVTEPGSVWRPVPDVDIPPPPDPVTGPVTTRRPGRPTVDEPVHRPDLPSPPPATVRRVARTVYLVVLVAMIAMFGFGTGARSLLGWFEPDDRATSTDPDAPLPGADDPIAEILAGPITVDDGTRVGIGLAVGPRQRWIEHRWEIECGTGCGYTADDDRVYTLTGEDGRAVLAAHDGVDGSRRWRTVVDAPVDVGHPVVIGDVLVLVAEGDAGELVEAFDPATGERLWSRSPARLGPVTAAYFALDRTGGGGGVEIVDPADGRVRWAAPGRAAEVCGMSVAVADADGTWELLDAVNGAPVGVFEGRRPRACGPSGVFELVDDTVVALPPEGSVLRWRAEAPGAERVHDADGVVLVVRGDRVTARDVATGTERWTVTIDAARTTSAPVVLNDHRLAFEGADGVTVVDGGTGRIVGERSFSDHGGDGGRSERWTIAADGYYDLQGSQVTYGRWPDLVTATLPMLWQIDGDESDLALQVGGERLVVRADGVLHSFG